MKSYLISLTKNNLQKNGFSEHYSYWFSKKIIDDFFDRTIPIAKYFWAYKRGFTPKKVSLFNLDENNYRNYLSDYDYFQLHPINGQFTHWIDDKLTFRYLLEPFHQYLPKYYFHLDRGEVFRLPDYSGKLPISIDQVISFLKEQKELAAKLLNASGGDGFYKLSARDDNYFLNDKKVSRQNLFNIFSEWRDNIGGGYLLTEYLHPCEEFSRIWPKSTNTIRVSIIRNKNEPPIIVDGFMRFGSSITNYTDSAISGGIVCRLNINDGTFYDGAIIGKSDIQKIKRHPDTDSLLEGVIPHWDNVKSVILDISNYISHNIYMGFDVVITDDGFKIIEINSHRGLITNQYYQPYLQDEVIKIFFTTQIAEKKQEVKLLKASRPLGKFLNMLKKLKHRVSLLTKTHTREKV